MNAMVVEMKKWARRTWRGPRPGRGCRNGRRGRPRPVAG